jgi:hypothetical protein
MAANDHQQLMTQMRWNYLHLNFLGVEIDAIEQQPSSFPDTFLDRKNNAAIRDIKLWISPSNDQFFFFF